ncbi:zinc finger ccch type domain containing protein [Diplodia corticola]|uniref:mRNA 3'-end-processing protein n=1 Tax=Diplodia corticola TaxID=236234 RepID=A0A1J9QY13_9PEZI|nr:zinc finger ccch type domain containing protein [Diplodia corticola]OJD32890.1 zinc finger ccch type domain containing protein [Diplodia corticola]
MAVELQQQPGGGAPMATAAATLPLAQRILQPDTQQQFNFNFSDFLKREYRFGLDPSRPICNAFKQGHCPLGNACPDKHPTSSAFNNSFHGSLVCKHWLRGLCKKGEACEFLHEYNLRRMPECNHYSRHLTCSNGDDCLYLHIDPESKRPPCPHYDRGFCPLGPRCAKKHVRRDRLCRYYLAGFCPNGKQCREGAHPRWQDDLKKPEVRAEKSPEELERERAQREEEARREEERERERFEERNPGMGGPGKFRGGWQGRKKRGGRRGGGGRY